MKQTTIELRVIEPSEGMVLTNGETYSKQVYLGIYDDISNWYEIPEDSISTEVSLEEP